MKRENYKFDPSEQVTHIVDWIKDYFVNNGPNSYAIVGISGGKDSTIVAKLCAMALGEDKVIGVQMPQHVQFDMDVSDKVVEWLGIESYKIDIGAIYDAGCKAMTDAGVVPHSYSVGTAITTNFPARLRMAMLYNVAAIFGGRVANTCNASENYVGYSTKYGDGAGDFSPLHDYTVSEIIQIGDYLGIPYEFVHKAPTDGMCGKTDEDNLGFTYKTLDNFILFDEKPDYDTYCAIQEKHNRNKHKLRYMPICHKKIDSEWCF